MRARIQVLIALMGILLVSTGCPDTGADDDDAADDDATGDDDATADDDTGDDDDATADDDDATADDDSTGDDDTTSPDTYDLFEVAPPWTTAPDCTSLWTGVPDQLVFQIVPIWLNGLHVYPFPWEATGVRIRNDNAYQQFLADFSSPHAGQPEIDFTSSAVLGLVHEDCCTFPIALVVAETPHEPDWGFYGFTMNYADGIDCGCDGIATYFITTAVEAGYASFEQCEEL